MWLDEIENLQDRYILERYVYGIAQETVRDSEYMVLHKYMIDNHLLTEYTSRSWSSDPVPTELLKKYGKEDLIRNLIVTDKTESIPSLGSREEVIAELSSIFEPGYMSEKEDGWNTQHTYDANGNYLGMNTRGRATDPMIKMNLADAGCVPYHIDCKEQTTVVGEAVLDNAAFEELKRMYPELNLKSQRAAVSTALANKEATHLLKVKAFQIKGVDDADETIQKLKMWNFDMPHFKYISTLQELFDAVEEYGNNPEILADSTDGMVYWKKRGGFRRAIRIGHWEEKIHYSYITGYDFSYNEHNISPSLSIFPRDINKQTQRNVNITNLARIIKYDLKIGSPIAFIMRSQATAAFDEITTEKLRDKYFGRLPIYQQLIASGIEDGKIL